MCLTPDFVEDPGVIVDCFLQFLAHLAKGHVSFSHHLASVVVDVVVLEHFFKRHLL